MFELQYQVLESVGVKTDTLQYIGEGANAVCFTDKRSKKVLKVTKDRHDYMVALTLINRNIKPFTKVYSAKEVNMGGKTFYIIEAKFESKIVADIPSRVLSDTVTIVNRYFRESYDSERNTSYKELIRVNGEVKDRSLTKVIYREYKKLFLYIKKRGVAVFDYHIENVAFSGGRLRVVDFGYSGGTDYSGDCDYSGGTGYQSDTDWTF